jgi:hypothetical protein
MITPKDTFYLDLLGQYTHTTRPQAAPLDLASHLPGRITHLRAIAFGLRSVRLDLRHVIRQLDYYESDDMNGYDADTLCVSLTTATVMLEGLLDGLIFCELDPQIKPSRKMNFQKTKFGAIDLRSHQDRILELKSYSNSNRVTYADFWTIADFWKHYLPYQPRPVLFEKGGCDIQVNLGDGVSGPIVKGLIVPVYNATCDIVENLSRRYGVEDLGTVERIKTAIG